RRAEGAMRPDGQWRSAHLHPQGRSRHGVQQHRRPAPPAGAERLSSRAGTAGPNAVPGLYRAAAPNRAKRGALMYPHRIRLAGPWELNAHSSEPGALATSASDPSLTLRALKHRVTIPCHFPDFIGTLRLTRRFGYPGRIDDYERVWLTFAAVAGRAAVCLN